MSDVDVGLVREGLELLASAGHEAVLERVHPDFEMVTEAEFAAEPQAYRGHEGFRRWWETFYEVMDEVRVEPASYHDAGAGVVVVDMVLRAVGQASGAGVSQRAFMLIRLRDGQMHRIEFFFTLEEALAAA